MNRIEFGRRGRVLAMAAAAFATISTTGCATIKYDASTVESLVAMNRVAPASSFERVGQFEENQRVVFVIAQLITVVDAKVEETMREQIQRTGGDAILNLRIHEEYDIIDFAIGAVQGVVGIPNLVQTRSISLRGDVVRWNTGFLENGGGQWLGQSCREVEIDNGNGASRTAHICVAPEASESVKLGLN